MKKQLTRWLFGFLLLAGTSATASAQTTPQYVARTPIASPSELVSGKYVINAVSGGEEAILYSKEGEQDKVGFWSSLRTFPDAGITDNAYIWDIEVVPAEDGTSTFTIKNVKYGWYWTVRGNTGNDSYPAKGNVYGRPNGDEFAIARYSLVAVPDGDTFNYHQSGTRFNLHLENAQFQNGNTIAYPYVHSNASGGRWASYWANNVVDGTAAKIVLIPVVDGTAEGATQVRTVTYNYSLANGTQRSITKNILEGENAVGHIPFINEYFIVSGLTESDVIVSETNTTFTIQGEWNFPMVYDRVYRINFKPSANPNNIVKYEPATESQAQKVTTNVAATSDRNVNVMWYFKFVRYNDNGWPVMTMHTLYDDTKGLEFEDNDSGHSAVLSDNPTELTFEESTWGNRQKNDFTLSFGAGNGNYTNDRGGLLSSWQNSRGKGDASVFRLLELTEEDYEFFKIFNGAETVAAAKANPTAENVLPLFENLNPNLTDEDYSIISNATALIDMGLIDAQGRENWRTFSASLKNAPAGEETHNSIKSAYLALTYEPVSFKAAYFSYQSDYLGVYNELPRRCGNESNGNRAWTIKPVAGGGFKMLNNYMGKYMQHSATQNPRFVAEADASVYRMEVFDAENKVVGFYIDELTDDKKFVNATTNAIVAGASNNGVKWVITLYPDDSEPAREYYNGAHIVIPSFSYGEGVGQYSKSAEYAAVEDVIEAGMQEGATPEQLRAAADAFRSVTTLATINMPQNGRFYRMHGINAQINKYLSSNSIAATTDNGDSKGTRLEIVEANNTEDHSDNTPNTVFYYTGSRLVALSDGMVVGNADGNDGHNKVLNEETNAGNVEFEEANILGKFYLKSGGRYIYNGFAYLDSGSGHNGDGYRWTLEDISWLPIPGSDQAYTTITSPVALTLKDHIMVYEAAVNASGRVELTEIAGNVIPANTPVVLYFENEVERNSTNHLVYLQIATGGDANASDLNDLKGGCLATAQESGNGKQYAVLNGTKFSALVADANIPGFKAYIEVSDANNHSLTTAAIEDIIVSGKVYSIKNLEDGRGYIYHNAAENGIWATSKADISIEAATTAAATDASYQWTVISDNAGKYYLYNLGAQKFASAFAKPGASNAGGAEFCWVFSDVPTAIDIQSVDWSPAANIFNIYGGQNTTNNRPAGMMIIEGNTNPVAGMSGAGARDGNGFIFTEIEGVTPDGVPTADKINAAHEEMAVAYTDAVAAADIDDPATGGVGYYTPDNLTTFRGAFTQVGADADAEAKYYAVVRAHNAVTNKEYNEFQPMHAYQLKVGDQYVNATATAPFFTLGALDEVKDSNNSNWRAEVNEDGTLRFTHVLGVEEGTEPAAAPLRVQRRAKVNQTVFFAATPSYDGLGNVTLGVEGIDSEGKVRVTSLGEDLDGTHTTAIREVEAAADCEAEVIYDLQGRRVNKAGHGFYIINGKKVIK